MAPNENSKNFPYSTLIWAVVALISIFLFKPELKGLLSKSDELTVFGITVKSSRTEILQLTDSINAHKNSIANLVAEVEGQEGEIKQLEKLKNKLEKDLNKCPGQENNTRELNYEFNQIFRNNTEIKRKADALKSVRIITDFNQSVKKD